MNWRDRKTAIEEVVFSEMKRQMRSLQPQGALKMGRDSACGGGDIASQTGKNPSTANEDTQPDKNLPQGKKKKLIYLKINLERRTQ
jgi:hypothetical protein